MDNISVSIRSIRLWLAILLQLFSNILFFLPSQDAENSEEVSGRDFAVTLRALDPDAPEA